MSDRDGSVIVCADRTAPASIEPVVARSPCRPLRTLRLGLLASACITAPAVAWAQCVPSGTELVYVCSGANTTSQAVTANPALHNVTATTVPGFSVDTTASGGSAIVITGDGELRYLDFNGSSLTGAIGGLRITTTGPAGTVGAVVINTTGAITAGGQGIRIDNNTNGLASVTTTAAVRSGATGISVQNGETTTDLTVNAATITSDADGIIANNSGTGLTSVTATGTIQSGYTGLLARSGPAATKNVTVNATTVNAAVYGILADNRGAAATSVTATGNVVGTSFYGIAATNGTVTFTGANTIGSIGGGNGTNLTVDAVGATGGLTGILAVNTGTGFTSVTATGDVVGTTAYGILAVNGQATFGADGLLTRTDGDNGTNLTVDAVNVRGGETGVYAVNTGTGTTSVTVTGLAQGGGIGVLARNDSATATDLRVGAGAVTAGQIGLFVSNSGTGLTSVSTIGGVQGGSTGIVAQNDVGATDLSVKAQGAVSGGGNGDGISVSNNGTGLTSVSVLGAVQGGRSGIIARTGATSTQDLTVNAASVSGGQRGIYALNRGAAATLVTATGDAAGTAQYGIAAVNGTVVFGTDDSIAEVTGNNGTNLTVEAAGASGGIHGILAVNTGTGFTSVTATGDVVGTLGVGIVAINGQVNLASIFPDVDGNNGTDLTVKAAGASGGFAGIYAENTGTGATSVTATGLVRGELAGLYAKNENTATNLTVNAASASGGIALYANNEGTGFTSVTATGTIQGGQAGIYIQNEAATTDLTVKAAAVNSVGYGILAANEGAGATLVMATGNVLSTQTIGILAANGKVDADLLPAVTGNSGTTLTVEAASVTGGVFGIAAVNTGTGATSVTATGDVVGTFGIGIVAVNGRADLTSVFPDVDGNNGTDLTVKAATASGNFAGIYAENTGTGATSVTAAGLVRGEQVGLYAKNENTATTLTVNAAAATGNIGIFANNEGTGFTSVTATGTVQGGQVGIYALHEVTATNLTVSAVRVESQGHSIVAVSEGTGATLVTTTGDVVGTAGIGILAVNGKVDDVFAALPEVTGNNGTSLTVEAAGATGGQFGVYAVNTGTGPTSVTTTGLVQGGFFALYVENKATATDLTVSAAAVNGTVGGGIFAGNAGTGATSVTATGNVTGSILVVNGTVNGNAVAGNNGTNLMVEAAGVTSGFLGVLAVNTGTGFTSVKATGDVVGTSGYGILAVNGQILLDNVMPTVVGNNGTGLTVEAAGVTGGQFGVYAVNTGTGPTSVTTTGLVQGGFYGLYVENKATATDLTVSMAAVNSTGGGGIFAGNAGTGATSVTATGNVTGSILVVNGTVNGNAVAGNNGTNLMVEAAGVTSGFLGVLAVNTGTGFTSVKATGDVVGTSGYGILAVNGQILLDNVIPTVVGNNGTGLTVEAAGVTGGQFGVYAVNTGTGPTLVSVSGVARGGINAIFATANNQAVDLQFATTAQVGNANLLSSALVVSASGSSVILTNNGQLTGAVQLTGLNNQVTNSGTWSTAGAVNSLGGPTSQLTNSAGGTFLAASSGATLETTQFQGAGNFLNRGIVSLRDGGAGDVVRFGGNAIMTATSVQAIDLGNGTADKVVVDGVANLAGTLVVSKTGGGYQLGGRYTVLTAAGGLNGRYSALAGDAGQISTFFSVIDAYDANNAYLEVAQQRPFTAAAFTPNQWAAAGGAQSLPIGNPLFNAIATLQTDAQARVAFDQISGEAHASGRTALNEGSRMIRDAVLGRLRNAFGGPALAPAPATAEVGSAAEACTAETCQAEGTGPVAPGRYAVWAQGLGSWGSTDGNGNAAGLFRTNAGFLVGADAQVFEVGRLGLFGGYTRTTFNVADRQSSGGSDNAHLGLYGGAQVGPLGVRLGAAYSWHTLSATRGVAFPGFADTLRSDYAARTVQVFGELGYRIPLDKVTFEPFANVAYSNLTTDGFTEKGGAAALSVAGSSTNVTTTTLGLRTAYAFQLGEAPSQVRGMLGWQHAFGDTTPLANMVLNGGAPFTVSGIPIARDSALIEAGFDVRLSERVSLGATYTGQFASGVQDQTVRASVTLNF